MRTSHSRAILVGCFLALAYLMPVSAVQAGKPNILHIHADDLRADALRALGNATVITPHLDSLVKQGFTFSHCYTQGSMIGAVCTPSRTMLLTGRSWQRIPGAPGATSNAKDPMTFLPKVLAGAGYQTWHMGKPGNAFTPGINTFETNITDAGTGNARVGSSKRLADRTIEFLQTRRKSNEHRPFYAYLAPPVPHDPRTAEEAFHSLYTPSKIPLSPAFLPLHPFNNGEMLVRDEKLAPWPRTPEDTRKQLAEYYACISGLDHHVGRIFQALRDSGEWDSTLIVFSSDNGLSIGEHGLFGKQNLYEYGGMHVPLVFAGPGVPKGKSDALVYLMDLYPTFANIGGAKVPPGVEGRDLIPVIQGRLQAVREVLYTGYRDCQRSLRDNRWKLIRYPLVDVTQLFDLHQDPHELVNLAAKSEQTERVVAMTRRLQQEMDYYGDKYLLTVDHPQPSLWTPPKAAKQ